MAKSRQGVIFDDKSVTDAEGSKKEISKLNSLVQKSGETLMRIKAVFPFNFFRDEIIIDATKVSVVQRMFFLSGNIRSVAYEDIFEVTTNYSIIFGTLTIVDRFFQESPLEINYLWKKDALRARRVIQGLMMVRKENIKPEKIPLETFLSKIEKLGTARVTIPD